ncbi:MarR family winged helix-turn-helix transcriptional regulator [Rhodococcus triatomae]|nr:MarR family transcriptional regulator [Rhodococcus triatomae BKS 15-14]
MQHSASVALVHEELVHLVQQLMTGERSDVDTPTFAQHSVLSYIDRNPGCRATQIADAFGVHRSTVSRQIKSCVDSGWVSADIGPVRSGHPLTLTRDGERTLDAANRSRQAEVADRVRDWPTDDVDTFARLLHQFRSTASPIPDNPTRGGDPNA